MRRNTICFISDRKPGYRKSPYVGLRIACDTLGDTVCEEESLIRKDDKLTHGSPLRLIFVGTQSDVISSITRSVSI